jgi:hypothetical protein
VGDHFQSWHSDAGTDRYQERQISLSVELSDPAKFFPWRLADENSEERLLTGLDADPESLVNSLRSGRSRKYPKHPTGTGPLSGPALGFFNGISRK